MESIDEAATMGRAGRAVSRRRPASMARSTEARPRTRIGSRCRSLRCLAVAAKRDRKVKSLTPRVKLRGKPKVGNHKIR